MDKQQTEIIMKLDYKTSSDAEKFISLIQNTNIEVSKIGSDEYSIIIK